MKRFAVLFSVLLTVAAILFLINQQRPLAVQVFPEEQLLVGETTRSYRLVVPHHTTRPAPLVIAFHGLGNSPESMANYSRLDQLAERQGFILVYPAARNAMWTTVVPDEVSLEENVDIQFFDQLLHKLLTTCEIDPARVYVMGMSNGGGFAHMLASARSEVISAMVVHSGTRSPQLPAPSTRIPLMLIAGSEDPALKPMREDAELCLQAGHLVEFVTAPHCGHQWSPRHNELMWKFLSGHVR
ncbi:MAG: dienelactone hydrolase family protein [Planctomycetaceae bacterium]|nr:dienelactone hydrolase family protein [Planctomycetaceae bacterium]